MGRLLAEITRQSTLIIFLLRLQRNWKEAVLSLRAWSKRPLPERFTCLNTIELKALDYRKSPRTNLRESSSINLIYLSRWYIFFQSTFSLFLLLLGCESKENSFVIKIKTEREVQRYEERFFFLQTFILFFLQTYEAISTESQMFMGKNNIVTFVTPSFRNSF